MSRPLALPCSIALALFLVATGGCGNKAEDATASAKTASYGCKAIISKVITQAPIEASDTGPDETKVLVSVWAAICAKLPEDVRASCATEKAPDGWISSLTGSTVTNPLDGTQGFTKTVKLTPRPQQHIAKGTSTVSAEDACKQAYVDACKSAGAAPGCETTPAFTNNGTIQSTMGGSAPSVTP